MSTYNPYRCHEKIIESKDIEIAKLKSEIELFKQGTIDFIKAIYVWNDILDATQLHDRIISDVLMVGLMDTLYETLYIPEDIIESIDNINNLKK